jgi:hypothetical protein
MKKNQLIKALRKAFPDIHGIEDGTIKGWGDCIFLGDAAEGGTIEGQSACNYYGYDVDPKEVIWITGVHRKLYDFLLKRGWYVQCHDPGTYMAYER